MVGAGGRNYDLKSWHDLSWAKDLWEQKTTLCSCCSSPSHMTLKTASNHQCRAGLLAKWMDGGERECSWFLLQGLMTEVGLFLEDLCSAHINYTMLHWICSFSCFSHCRTDWQAPRVGWTPHFTSALLLTLSTCILTLGMQHVISTITMQLFLMNFYFGVLWLLINVITPFIVHCTEK